MSFEIALLPGDGIGPEITEATLKVLNHLIKKFELDLTYTEYPFGGTAIDEFNDPFPEITLNGVKNSDAVLLAAIGDPKFEKSEIRPEQGLLILRKTLDVFANLRLIKVFDSLVDFSALKKEIVQGVDILFVRELLGGIYFGEPKILKEENAIDSNVYQKFEIERIAKMAFELAKKRNYLHKVTSVDKQNVLMTSKLWRKTVDEIAKNYPDIELQHYLVDAMAQALIRNPKQFDVIVTDNLFGDILSDEASEICGSLGLIPSASLSEQGPHLYEPIHGSAPDIKGKGIANPTGMILSLALLFSYSLNRSDIYELIFSGVEKTYKQGFRTPDLQGNLSTFDWTDKLIDNL